ncbi:Gfo/Idh/MocA family protein [Paenibacillus cymbidii]|uniref:Gfo/Idh/MocA family protein n=1 Tax=Paenibacillus cymbidii TaxID=1639034 RepID=UPI0010822A2F|nr:Gfo/Idh/MocA family oxidoreductase [Paenibacillus cymbidii]
MERRVKLAVLGGNRGQAFNAALGLLREEVELTCICDLSGETIASWQARFPGIRGYADYADMLETGDCDAVFIATPIAQHAGQAIAALRAGKHVLCEVYAADTIDEAWALVEAVEQSGLVYMLAENYCYLRANMAVLNMVQSGVFGDITFAEGAYVHDCRRLRLDERGALTWRGEQLRRFRGNSYPTHSLGPIARWLGVNRTDRLVRSATFVSRTGSLLHYIADRYGADHPALQPGFWAHGDTVTTVVETASGALATLRFDGDSARPHNMAGYSLQGTKGAYLSGRYEGEDGLVWLEGIGQTDEYGQAAEWDRLSALYDRFEHPAWRRYKEQAQRTGHGGGDFFVLRDFVAAIREGTPPPIDVYDAAAWSAVVPVSAESVRRGGAPVEIPDFTRGRWRG